MWWTKAPAPARAALSLAAAAALLSGCAGIMQGQTGPRGATAPHPDALTPLDQYAATAAPQTEEVALAPHAYGLSQAQHAALAAFVARWREAGGEAVVVTTPAASNCRCDPRATARAAADSLAALGVPAHLLRIADGEPGAGPDAPVTVRYSRWTAHSADCLGGWSNLTSTYDNSVTGHFGCASARNLAAMVANPRDLVQPAASEPGDATRRSVVLDKYRQGQVTSTTKDDQAQGTLSTAVAK